MKIGRLRTEHVLYLIIFLAAAGIRLLMLGRQPLGDLEAAWALRAADPSTVFLPGTGSNPAYLIITRFLFDLFGETSYLSRFWPALMGSALVLAPFFFRRWLGPRAALVLAAGLALDPGLVAISRQAGSPVPAVAAIFLAAGTWMAGYPVAAGIFTGLALLAGPGLWPGLLGLGVSVLVFRKESVALFSIRKPDSESPGDSILTGDIDSIPSNKPGSTDGEVSNRNIQQLMGGGVEPRAANRPVMLSFGAAAGVTFILVGTAFLTKPWGAGSAASSLTDYLGSWLSRSGMAAGPFAMALLLYESLPVLFALLGGVRSLTRRLTLDRFLGLWFLIASILAVINPGRQPADWVWALIPLWGLAAREISRHLQLERAEVVPTLVQVGLGILVLAFISLNFASLLDTYQVNPLDPAIQSKQNLQWLVLAGAAILLILTSYLIAWGWAAPSTMRGLLWAVLGILLVFTISSTWRSSGLDGKYNPEIWQGSTRPAQIDLLTKTMNDLSTWNTGFPASLDTAVQNIDSLPLRWALRADQQVFYTPALVAGSSPALIVSPEDEQPGQPSAYRGQDFTLATQTVWPSTSIVEWIRWMTFRRVTETPIRVILWARSDLFADGDVAPTTQQ